MSDIIGIAHICRVADIDTHSVIKQLTQELCSDLPLVNGGDMGVSKLEILYTLVKTYSEGDKKLSERLQECDSIVWRLCLPLLKQLKPSTDDKEVTRQMLMTCCDLLVACLVKTPISECHKVLETLEVDLQNFCEESECPMLYNVPHPESTDTMDIACIIEFLRSYLKNNTVPTSIAELGQHFDALFAKLICTFSFVSEKVFARVISGGLFHLLRIEKGKTDTRLDVLWSEVQSLCAANDGFEEQALLMFCSLADFFFPVSENIPFIDLRESDSFWGIVQRGMYSGNPLSRKRSLYLLKRVVDTCEKRSLDVAVDVMVEACPVFQWRVSAGKDQTKLWDDYILLVETLEEKQVHVIKPLLWRMQSLMKAAAVEGSECSLHTSWLVTILRRCFQHESHHVVRWAVDTVLEMDLTAVPLLTQLVARRSLGSGSMMDLLPMRSSRYKRDKPMFLVGDFLYILQELRLYLRPTGAELGSCPPVGIGLINFFKNCIVTLGTTEKQRGFLTVLCQTLLSSTWGSIPMFYLCQALAAIPPAPIITSETLVHIKDMLVTLMTTLEQLPKGAIQCFLLQTILHLADRTKVSVEDFAVILAVFERKESLQRGTELWGEVVAWLKESVSPGHHWSVHNVQTTIHSMVTNFLADQSESGVFNSMLMTKISRLLILAIDADIFKATAGQSGAGISVVLGQVTQVINSINSHAYMATVKADRAVALLATIATEQTTVAGSPQGPAGVVQDIVTECWQELLIYVGRRVTQDMQEMGDVAVLDVYCDCLAVCVRFLTPAVCAESLQTLATLCINTLHGVRHNIPKYLHEQLMVVCSMWMLSAITEIISSITDTTVLTTSITKTIEDYAGEMDLTTSFPKLPARGNKSNTISQKDWGRVVSRYISSQWQCIHFLLERSPERLLAKHLLDACYDAFDVGTRDSDVVVFQCVQCLLPKLMGVSEEHVCDVVRVAWTKASEELHTATYWRKLECFIRLICQNPLLLAPPGTQVNTCLLEHMALLFRLGEEKMGVVNLLMEHLSLPLSHVDHGICVASNLCSVLADACVFGGIHKRTDRLILELSTYIESKGRKCAVNDVMSRTSKSDGIVRVFVMNFLSRLEPSNTVHVEFVLGLITELQLRYNTLVEAADYRQYNNSLCHRQKNRIFQALCVLEPFLSPDKGQEEIWGFVWRCLVFEAHPSVRHMQEWILMRQVHRFPHLVSGLWEHFSQFNDKRNLSLCSLMHVVSRLGPHLPSHTQKDFYSQALTCLLPWCMAHHFNTRVHAQASLSIIWQQCQMLGQHDLIAQHSILQTILTFHADNNNSTKNLQKLITNYFYQTFDFLGDYSMETIFLTLPRLAMLTHEEWLQPELFSDWDGQWSRDRPRLLPLYNPTPQLQHCSPGPWKIKPPVDADLTDEDLLTEGDVQKKIMPWRLMTPEEGSQSEYQAKSKKVHKPGGLILVTSLIDKIPNLGGLCRTSEIFGVSEFIIGNLCFIEDKTFQCLSVTAQNWIPITEVPPYRLQEFLETKRRDGYTLVGAEQTANSISLTQYKFPPKTLLLLGCRKKTKERKEVFVSNEKEGIPVNLIQLLDVCVEIPQQGIIRSLNVHVSGALLVWEYARQQMEATDTTS